MAQPMSMTASDVEFDEATDEQLQIVWELPTQGWEASIPKEDYMEREKYLAQLELNRDSRTQHWVLYLKGYPRQVIASCQSTRRPVLISDGFGEPARQGHAYSVSNVYTSSPYRRQGMAAYLLCRLQVQMDLDGACSVLYSNSGPRYYDALGWKSIDSQQATLTLLSRSHLGSPTLPSPCRTVPIKESELPDLCQKDQLRLTKTFNCLPVDGKTHFTFLPTYPEISWHLARAKFDAQKTQPATNGTNDTDGTDNTNGINGINGINGTNGSDSTGHIDDTNSTDSTSHTDSTDDTSHSSTSNDTTPPLPTLTPGAITLSRRTWILWTHDWRDKRLRILRIPRLCDDENEEVRAGLVAPREQDVDDVEALLEAAVAEADRCGLSKVVVWNPDDAVRAACKGLADKNVEGVKLVFEGCLDGGRPLVRARGGKKVPAVVWEENYGYCWC